MHQIHSSKGTTQKNIFLKTTKYHYKTIQSLTPCPTDLVNEKESRPGLSVPCVDCMRLWTSLQGVTRPKWLDSQLETGTESMHGGQDPNFDAYQSWERVQAASPSVRWVLQ